MASHSAPNALPLAVSWLILSVVVALFAFVAYMTFVSGLPFDSDLTLRHWKGLARSYVLVKVVPNTLAVGVGTVLVCVFFAAPLAWLLNRTTLPHRRLWITLIAVTVIVPGFVKAMGWLMLINVRIGLLNKVFESLFGLDSVPLNLDNPYGMAWVMGLSLTPTMFFIISGPIRVLDPSLEEAAAVAGAKRLATALRISLPLILPALFGGAIYTFMTAISMFEIPAMLGAAGGKSPVLASELFYAIHPNSADAAGAETQYGAAGVYGMLIATPSMIALFFYHRTIRQAHRYAVITGKGYRPRLVNLGRWTAAGLAFVWLFLLLAVVLPLLVLVWASLLPYLQMPSLEALSKLSLQNYGGYLLDMVGGLPVIGNTVVLVLSVAFLVPFFSFMISWVVVRTQAGARRLMDGIAMLPHAIPGLAFAFALYMLGIFSSKYLPWFPFAGTVGIIVLANVLNRLAYGTRITNAALLQVGAELEECAKVCGARNLGLMWQVIVPLVKPSLLVAGLWTALLTFREVSMALFLTGSRNAVLAVAVWDLWRTGDLGVASAAAVMMVAIMGFLVLLTLMATGGRLTQE